VGGETGAGDAHGCRASISVRNDEAGCGVPRRPRGDPGERRCPEPPAGRPGPSAGTRGQVQDLGPPLARFGRSACAAGTPVRPGRRPSPPPTSRLRRTAGTPGSFRARRRVDALAAVHRRRPGGRRGGTGPSGCARERPPGSVGVGERARVGEFFSKGQTVGKYRTRGPAGPLPWPKSQWAPEVPLDRSPVAVPA
jgi:hypothetical protein